MTPQEMETRILDLEVFVKSLTAGSTIPFDVNKALEDRLNLDVGDEVTESATSTGANIKAVDEAGVATYSVLPTPDKYLQVTIDGTVYDIPAYNQ